MATWTAATAIPTGQLITSSWMTNTVNAINFLGAAGGSTVAKDLFFARQGAGQALTASVAAALTFGGEDFDTANGHSTATNTSRYVVQADGKYRLTGGIAIPASTTSQQIIGAFYKNGTAISNAAKVSVQIPNVAYAQMVVMPTIYASLSKTSTNDYVELWVTATTSGFTTETTPVQSFFGVEWIGA